MTTSKRSWYEGASYHITARGNHRNDIFRDEEDFKYYIKIIEEALLYYINYNYEVITYCLMDNHVHLMIKTDCMAPGKLIASSVILTSQRGLTLVRKWIAFEMHYYSILECYH